MSAHAATSALPETADISIVMPTWNRPQFLRASLDSVLAQGLAFRELIIVDDGSDAATRSLLEEFSTRPRVRVSWLNHCGNPGAVRNVGIRQAEGRYVAFADSDDTWHPHKLQRQWAALRAQPACRWTFTASSLIDARDRPVRLAVPPTTQSRPLLESLALLNFGIALPSVVVERALLLEAGLFDESFGCYADYHLWIRLAARAPAAALQEELVNVRLHDGHFARGRGAAPLRGREKFLASALPLVDPPEVRAQLRRMRALDAARLARVAAAEGDADEVERRLRNSVADGGRLPRWWVIAAHARARLWSQRTRRIVARWRSGA